MLSDNLDSHLLELFVVEADSLVEGHRILVFVWQLVLDAFVLKAVFHQLIVTCVLFRFAIFLAPFSQFCEDALEFIK